MYQSYSPLENQYYLRNYYLVQFLTDELRAEIDEVITAKNEREEMFGDPVEFINLLIDKLGWLGVEEYRTMPEDEFLNYLGLRLKREQIIMLFEYLIVVLDSGNIKTNGDLLIKGGGYFGAQIKLKSILKKATLQSIPTIELNNEKGLIEKLKWKGKPSQLGYIMNELAKKGFIEIPRTKGKASFGRFAAVLMGLFEVDTTIENLDKELNPNSNSMGNKNTLKFEIPDIKDI